MTLAQLQKQDDELFAQFHPMPNNAERARLYKKWMVVRNQMSIKLYGKGK